MQILNRIKIDEAKFNDNDKSAFQVYLEYNNQTSQDGSKHHEDDIILVWVGSVQRHGLQAPRELHGLSQIFDSALYGTVTSSFSSSFLLLAFVLHSHTSIRDE